MQNNLSLKVWKKDGHDFFWLYLHRQVTFSFCLIYFYIIWYLYRQQMLSLINLKKCEGLLWGDYINRIKKSLNMFYEHKAKKKIISEIVLFKMCNSSSFHPLHWLELGHRSWRRYLRPWNGNHRLWKAIR